MLDLSARAPYRIVEGVGRREDRLRRRPARRRPAPLAALRGRSPTRRPSRWWPPRPWPRSARLAARAAASRPADAGACRSRRRRPTEPSSRDRSARGRSSLHRPPDQPRLQGRRPPGHLPALRRHQRPQRRGEPGRQRQGHPEAQRGALGPGPRPDPEDQRPRLHPRRQRHPHRQARDLQKEEQDRRKLAGGAGAGRATWPTSRKRISYAKAADAASRAQEGRRPLRARADQRRHAHQHDDHHGPARPTSRRRRTSSPTSTAPRRRSRSRRASWSRAATSRATSASSGASTRADAAVRQHHEPDLPELDHPERPGCARAAAASRPTRAARPSTSAASGRRAAATRSTCRPAGFNTAIGISLGNILGNFNLDVALTALERQGRGRLLSTPKVTTQNNQAAEIKQGVQIPIQTVANNTVTVQFKDAVLTLKVTPQITDAGTVILSLEVENNAADFANRGQRHPARSTRSRRRRRCWCGTGRRRSSAASTRATSRPRRTARRSWASMPDPGLPVPQPRS